MYHPTLGAPSVYAPSLPFALKSRVSAFMFLTFIPLIVKIAVEPVFHYCWEVAFPSRGLDAVTIPYNA